MENFALIIGLVIMCSYDDEEGLIHLVLLSATFDITKNIATTISGQPAWRVDYITSLSGVQSVIFVIKDNKLYELGFFTDPLKVPYQLPKNCFSDFNSLN